MATRKGLEPSTSSVTGWRSNQLSYRAKKMVGVKMDAESNALPASERLVSATDSTVSVMVIPTDEEMMIAMDTANLVK